MEGVELKEEWQDEDFPRYCQSLIISKITYKSWFRVLYHMLCFKSHMNHNPSESMITCCLIVRPLPEEEELEDELFAGPSEEIDPGNENRIVNSALLYNIKGYFQTHTP